ncbi:MAG TPA: squalene/phytoene synthase family protein [Polyangiaceae bacterium]|jgi:farnesyl-diphosphate farnesyltransferase|nr:squalene/phytoene synthase family protein [Polyangiaceae bacterium]
MPSLYELLSRTSRTFALAIPLLPEPTRSTTCLSYLIFRIADTLEDAESWSRAARLEALAEWRGLLLAPAGSSSARSIADVAKARTVSRRWLGREVVRDEAYAELIEEVPQVLSALGRLDAGTQRIVRDHALRSADGMSATLERADAAGNVRIEDLEGLREYCYAVAGIVGELLTELFVHDCSTLARVKETLVETQVAFGEGLQLVNILKDEAQDAKEGRVYLPPGVTRSEVLELAREDLAQARRYIDALVQGGAPAGFFAFTSLSAELAEATLVRLEEDGPGAKVPRAEVMRMFARYRLVASEPAAHSARAQSGK